MGGLDPIDAIHALAQTNYMKVADALYNRARGVRPDGSYGEIDLNSPDGLAHPEQDQGLEDQGQDQGLEDQDQGDLEDQTDDQDYADEEEPLDEEGEYLDEEEPAEEQDLEDADLYPEEEQPVRFSRREFAITPDRSIGLYTLRRLRAERDRMLREARAI
jgi:hypothetical protein